MRKKAWRTTRINQRNRLFKRCEKFIRLYKRALKQMTIIALDPTLSIGERDEKLTTWYRTAEVYLDLIRQNGVILPGTIN